MTNQQNKICPLLSAAGVDLFICDNNCVFYVDNECLLKNTISQLTQLLGKLADQLTQLSNTLEEIKNSMRRSAPETRNEEGR